MLLQPHHHFLLSLILLNSEKPDQKLFPLDWLAYIQEVTLQRGKRQKRVENISWSHYPDP